MAIDSPTLFNLIFVHFCSVIFMELITRVRIGQNINVLNFFDNKIVLNDKVRNEID